MFYDFITKYTDICYRKREKPLQCKTLSHFLNKNIGIFQILTYEILTKNLTNDVVSFKQPGHGEHIVNYRFGYFKMLLNLYTCIDLKLFFSLLETNQTETCMVSMIMKKSKAKYTMPLTQQIPNLVYAVTVALRTVRFRINSLPTHLYTNSVKIFWN